MKIDQKPMDELRAKFNAMSPKVAKAFDFCVAAHESINQKRDGNGRPYWTHPVQVADALDFVLVKDTYPGLFEDIQCVALLHDVLEDVADVKPEFGEAAILKDFGQCVLGMVQDLTKKPKTAHGRHYTYEKAESDRLNCACVPPVVRLVKLADIHCNTFDFLAMVSPTKWARAAKWLANKSLFISALTCDGDACMRARLELVKHSLEMLANQCYIHASKHMRGSTEEFNLAVTKDKDGIWHVIRGQQHGWGSSFMEASLCFEAVRHSSQ